MADDVKTAVKVEANGKGKVKAAAPVKAARLTPEMYDVTYVVSGKTGRVRVSIVSNEDNPDTVELTLPRCADLDAAVEAATLAIDAECDE